MLILVGVIVRANDYDLHQYLVLWSREFNHSFIYRNELDNHIWTGVCFSVLSTIFIFIVKCWQLGRVRCITGRN